MSRVPVSTGRFSMPAISLPRRSARGTPRRLMPIRVRSSLPLLFSTISWARRTSVRSTSEADISLPFTRRAAAFVFSVISTLETAVQETRDREPERSGVWNRHGGATMQSAAHRRFLWFHPYPSPDDRRLEAYGASCGEVDDGRTASELPSTFASWVRQGRAR